MADIGMFVDVPCTSQPAYRYARMSLVDWSNSITNGLEYIWTPSDSDSKSNIGRLGILYTQLSVLMSDRVRSGTLVTTEYRNANTSAAWSEIFGMRYENAGYTEKDYFMFSSRDTAVHRRYISANSGFVTEGTCAALPTLGNSRHHAITWDFRGTTTKVNEYVNAVDQGALTPIINENTPWGTGRSRLLVGGSAAWGVSVNHVFLFNRILSKIEIKSLSENPWQIFKPKRQFISYSPKSPWSMRESKMRGITDLVTTTVQEPAFTKPYPIVQTRQPQGVAEIDWSNPDWSNPVTKGLGFLVHPATAAINLVTGKVASTNNTRKFATVKGISAKAASGKGMVFSEYPILTSDGSGTGDFAVSVLANPASTATKYALFSQDWLAAGQFYIVANMTTAYAVSAGTLCFLTDNGLGGGSGVQFAGGIDGKYHLFTAVRRGSLHEIWIDRALVASASLTLRDVIGFTNEALTSVCVGGLAGYSGYDNPSDTIISWGYNRAPQPAEIKSLSDNPWQIFKPNQQLIWGGK